MSAPTQQEIARQHQLISQANSIVWNDWALGAQQALAWACGIYDQPPIADHAASERPSGAGTGSVPSGEVLTEEPPADSIVEVRGGKRFTRLETVAVSGWIELPMGDGGRELSWWAKLVKQEPRLVTVIGADS
jgi:hypothetical protein